MDNANGSNPYKIEICEENGYRFSIRAIGYLLDFYRLERRNLLAGDMIDQHEIADLIRSTGAPEEQIMEWIQNKLDNEPKDRPYEEELSYSFMENDEGDLINTTEVAPHPLITPINPKDQIQTMDLERERPYVQPPREGFQLRAQLGLDPFPPPRFFPESVYVNLPDGATNNYSTWTKAQIIDWAEIVLAGLDDENLDIIRNQNIDGSILEDNIRDQGKWLDLGVSLDAWRLLQSNFNAVANEFNGYRQ